MSDTRTLWLNTCQLSKDVWRIDDGGTVCEFLIVGDERALLLDCGWGIGDLPQVVKSIARLPVLVVNTHGHTDHTCGNYQFDSAYIHESDVHLLKKSYNPAVRSRILPRFPKNMLPEGFSETAWVNAPLRHYVPFNGPGSFDLGNRIVDSLETPGHTPGCICLYDRRERLLFTGDNIMSNTQLNLPDSLPLATFARSMGMLATMADEVDRVIPSHGPVSMKPGCLRRCNRE